MSRSGNLQPGIDNSEHIGPSDTGDNIEAKRVASYIFNTSTNTWERSAIPPINTFFDHVDVTNTGVDEDTLIYKADGATVKTLVIGYAAGAEKVSDSITSLDFS